MAGLLEKITLKLDLQGFEQIQGLGKTFKKLETNAVLTQRQIKGLRTAILGVGNGAKNTIGGLNAQVDALTRVRESARIGSRQFNLLTQEIIRVKTAIDSANASMNKTKFGRKDMFQGLGIAAGATAFGGPLPGVTGLIGGGISKAMGQGFASGATTGVGIGFAAKPIVEGIGQTTAYASSIEKAKIALKGITKDQESYNIALAAAEKATNDYNVPQEVAIRGITRLSAAVLGAGGNIHNATEAFLNTTVAIKGTAGSAEDVKSAITAMVQIFSKGKVSAEELSGQLGERFPAAVTKFAKANNISTQQLQKNLKDGTVGLDMLSKFIESLGEEYAPLALKIAQSNEEAGARSQIAMNKMKIAVGNALRPIGADFQMIAAQLATDFIPAFKSLANLATLFLKPLVAIIGFLANNFEILQIAVSAVAGALAGLAIQKLVIGFGLLNAAIVRVTASHRVFNFVVAKNKYVVIGSAIAALIVIVSRFGSQFKKTAEDIKDGLMGQSLEQTEKDLEKLEEKIAKYEKMLETGPQRSAAFIKNQLKELEKEREAYEEFIDKETAVAEKAKFDALEKEKQAKSPFVQFKAELEEFEVALERVAVSGFKKLEDTIMEFVTTGKLAFKDLVTSVINDLTRLMLRQTVTRPLFNAFTSALTGGFTAPMGSNDVLDSVFKGGLTPNQADIIGNHGFVESVISAKGNTFAKNGIVPYGKGGVIRKPTLSLMGEQGAEAILPLQRGRGGRLGVAMQGGGGGTTNVNYTGPTLNFNGDEYVPKSAVGSIISAAAARGESKTISSLKNSRGRRASLGL